MILYLLTFEEDMWSLDDAETHSLGIYSDLEQAKQVLIDIYDREYQVRCQKKEEGKVIKWTKLVKETLGELFLVDNGEAPSYWGISGRGHFMKIVVWDTEKHNAKTVSDWKGKHGKTK